MAQKQSVLLGLRDKLEKNLQHMLNDMLGKFKNKQGIFIGHNKTYTALKDPDTQSDFADDPTKRSYVHVASTVEEQLTWMKEHSADFLKTVLSVEKTNSTGIKAKLTVDGEDWGEFSTLELLRLKSILDGTMKNLIKEIPIRKEEVLWVKSTNPNYSGREIWENKEVENFASTTIKRKIVIADQYASANPTRPPVTDEITTKLNVGKYTTQDFSGEITNKERAEMETKLDKLSTAIIAALAEANDVEAQESNLGDKMLEYLF